MCRTRWNYLPLPNAGLFRLFGNAVHHGTARSALASVGPTPRLDLNKLGSEHLCALLLFFYAICSDLCHMSYYSIRSHQEGESSKKTQLRAQSPLYFLAPLRRSSIMPKMSPLLPR